MPLWLRYSGDPKIGQIVPEMRHMVAAYEAVQGFDIVHDHTLLSADLLRAVP